MQFTEEHLISFQKMYKEQFGEDIDRAEALRQATALVSLVKLTYKPISKEDFIKYSNWTTYKEMICKSKKTTGV